MIKFKSIKDFATFKEECLFCQAKLDFVLTNWFGVNKPGLPLINSSLKEDHFTFKFKHNSPSSNINTKGDIDAVTNILTFQDPAKFPLTINNPISEMVNVLEGLKPHVELQCNNKKCRMNYYVSSSAFSFKQEPNKVTVKPFLALMECFLWNNLWIQSSYTEDTTMITMVTGSVQTDKTIVVPKLNFQNLSKDKIINKIKTMVTFS